MKMLEYETANPGQDFDELEKEHFDPQKDLSRPVPVISFAPNGISGHKEDGFTPIGTDGAAEPRETDGWTADPDTSAAGQGSYRVMSVSKSGGRYVRRNTISE